MRIGVRTATGLLALVWPRFVEHRGWVLLAGSELNAERNAGSCRTASDLEALVSHTHLLDEFRHRAQVHVVAPDDGSCFDERHPDFRAAVEVGRAMAAMWAAKLRQDFPHYRFRVYFTRLDNPIVRFHRVREGEPPWASDAEVAAQPAGDAAVWDTAVESPVPAG